MEFDDSDHGTDARITGAQIRAARGLLNISVSELAERTGLSLNTVRKAEATNGVAALNKANSQLLSSTLRAAGIIFIPAGSLGAGVRLKDPDQEPSKRRRDG